MARIAIGERLLPGATLDQRLGAARELGIAGIEFTADGLDERIDDIESALRKHGLSACGITMGRAGGWLSADRDKRDRAADLLRRALTCALDLEAEYVAFVPQYGESDLPDLTPFASPVDLQKELLIWLLRGVSDLAEAMDAALALLPVNRGESTFLTRIEGAAFFRREVRYHPNIMIAADTCHASLEEADLLASLKTQHEAISVIYLRDDNGRLPGQGALPFAELGDMLLSVDYRGWLVLAGAAADGESKADELSDCLAFLRRCKLANCAAKLQ